MSTLVEIGFHGRGGQGGITASRLLVTAAHRTGKFPHVMAFPVFGPERRGAPVGAYARISDRPLHQRTKIYNPDILVIMDESILASVNVINTLKEHGLLLVNTSKDADVLRERFNVPSTVKIGVVDILGIDLNIGLLIEETIPVLNTPILGAFCKLFDAIPLETMEDTIREHFKDGKKAELNVKGARIAYEKVKVA